MNLKNNRLKQKIKTQNFQSRQDQCHFILLMMKFKI